MQSVTQSNVIAELNNSIPKYTFSILGKLAELFSPSSQKEAVFKACTKLLNKLNSKLVNIVEDLPNVSIQGLEQITEHLKMSNAMCKTLRAHLTLEETTPTPTVTFFKIELDKSITLFDSALGILTHRLQTDFKADVYNGSKESLSKIWLSKEDDIWDELYLKGVWN